jgi:hypothetical protein
MMCADVVEACWTDQNGQVQRADPLLENISPSGASRQFDAAVPSGVSLRFACNKHDFSGQVRYCQYNQIGYFVGVELAPQSH